MAFPRRLPRLDDYAAGLFHHSGAIRRQAGHADLALPAGRQLPTSRSPAHHGQHDGYSPAYFTICHARLFPLQRL